MNPDSREPRVATECSGAPSDEANCFHALLDSIPDTIYFKDVDSRFVLVSRSKIKEILECIPDIRARRAAAGLPVDVPECKILSGMTDFDIMQEKDAHVAYEDEQEVIRTGVAMIGKIEKQITLDGTRHWWMTSKVPWRNSDGSIAGTFGISKEVTALKEAEGKLELMNRQLIDASRQAGMAEIAANVLHNVGNVLNSVNVSATLVADQFRRSKIANVTRCCELLRDHEADLATFLSGDPKGKMLVPYLTNLAESLSTEHASITVELESLRRNIEHIKVIVSMQQSYAKTSGVAETISVTDLVEDALRMNAGSLERHNIDIVRDYQARPVITLEKHKVLQVLVNLMRNAKYACDESGRTEKQMILRITADNNGVAICVIDNGVGIPQENLTRIFAHGFTTRKDGHGFGLHSGALAAKEIGGSLTAHSAGRGQGATFVLELPYKAKALTDDKRAA